MYTIIERRTINPARLQETMERAQRDFFPHLQTAPGFIGFYLVPDEANGINTAVLVWESKAHADAFESAHRGWLQAPDQARAGGAPGATDPGLGPYLYSRAVRRPGARLRPAGHQRDSDGLRLYFYALTAHFGSGITQGRRRVWQVAPTLLYGQVQKRYCARRLVQVSQRVLCGTGERVRTTLQGRGPARYREHRLRATRTRGDAAA